MATFTFLGTGTSTGVPLLGCRCATCISTDPRDQRLRTSGLISLNGLHVTIDCGPDFRQQLLRENIYNIEAILFTHGHRDHTAGLDDIRAINFMQHKSIPIWVTDELEVQLEQDFRYMFDEKLKYPGVGEVDVFRFNEEPFTVFDGLVVQPISLLHGHLPVHGFRLGNLVYITDASKIPDHSWPLLEGVEFLIINALRDHEHHAHFNVTQALAVSERLGNPKTYFTHIAHQMGPYTQRMPLLPNHVQLAYDGLSIEFQHDA
jgi:phosphoribosyl 1,2-cyclic phosphate phosphodiesterase